MGGAPAGRLDSPIHQRRPDRAADIIAAGDDGHGKAAIAFEPVRGLGHQRAESGRSPQPDQKMHRDELPQRAGKAGGHIGRTQENDAERYRRHDAEAIGDLAGGDAAEPETEHGERKGQRHRAARRPEFGLDRGEHDHDRPHADAADRADHKRQREPHPGLGRVRNEGGGVSGIRRSVHSRNFGARNLPVKQHGAIIGMQMRGTRTAPVVPGRCHRVRAKRGPKTGSASNYDVQLHIGEPRDLRCAIPHRRSGPSDHPGMTGLRVRMASSR